MAFPPTLTYFRVHDIPTVVTYIASLAMAQWWAEIQAHHLSDKLLHHNRVYFFLFEFLKGHDHLA